MPALPVPERAMSDKLRRPATTSASGDAVLVTFPDNGTTLANILIDVGNVLSGKGGDDSVFKPVVEAIKAELGGKPLDLYVMTHEHMDHIQGLPYAKEKAQIELDVDFAWITASAAPTTTTPIRAIEEKARGSRRLRADRRVPAGHVPTRSSRG